MSHQIPAPIPPYQKKTIPGKGIGMVAALSISPGSVIIIEQPLFTIPRHTFDTLSTPSAKETVLLEFAKLPNDQQKAFLNLHNAQVKSVSELSEIESIIRTNAFGLGPEGIRSGVFDECSRFNHSCAPNAHFAWHEPTHDVCPLNSAHCRGPRNYHRLCT